MQHPINCIKVFLNLTKLNKMLNNKKQNYHHSKLPNLGLVAKIPDEICNRVNGIRANTKHIVIAFPLCDNVLPYSKGIHTCLIKSLHDGKIHKISGFYLVQNN